MEEKRPENYEGQTGVESRHDSTLVRYKIYILYIINDDQSKLFV